MGSFIPPHKYKAMLELVPFISGPPEFVAGIASCAGAEYINGYYEVNCDEVDTIPDLSIVYEQVPLRISSDKFITKIEDRCVLALAIQSGAGLGPDVYLGTPLFKQYCISVNFAESWIGFNEVKGAVPTNSSVRTVIARAAGVPLAAVYCKAGKAPETHARCGVIAQVGAIVDGYPLFGPLLCGSKSFVSQPEVRNEQEEKCSYYQVFMTYGDSFDLSQTHIQACKISTHSTSLHTTTTRSTHMTKSSTRSTVPIKSTTATRQTITASTQSTHTTEAVDPTTKTIASAFYQTSLFSSMILFFLR